MNVSGEDLEACNDSFIGSTFPTPKGGTLTVISINKGSLVNRRARMYVLECSLCSTDYGLFPLNSIQSTKVNLLSGKTPCSCSNFIYKEWQWRVKVNRECKERGYIFHGWVGDFKSAKKTKISLENPATGNKWESTSISSFMMGVGDPVQGNINCKNCKTLDDSRHIQDFLLAGFTEKYTFTRNVERRAKDGSLRYWDYTCPICSGDEYVKAGLCSGVFTSLAGGLKKGKKACRCGSNYLWTESQREYQIEKVCKEEGLTFKGWSEGGFKNSNSKFKWLCGSGHECEVKVRGFFGSGTRCKACHILRHKNESGFYGFYPHRAWEADYLYVVDFEGEYLKVGRSFDVNRRLADLKRVSSCKKVTLSCVLTSNHKTIFELEQSLHVELSGLGLQYYPSSWNSQECFDVNCLFEVKRLLRQKMKFNEDLKLGFDIDNIKGV